MTDTQYYAAMVPLCLIVANTADAAILQAGATAVALLMACLAFPWRRK